ncbi:MAG: hypothetical protein V1792_16040 [Pseudomonadota bacterium]
MQTENETISKTYRNACPSDDQDSVSGLLKDARARLSPDRLELLERTLRVREAIGKVSPHVTELVHEMREQGA